MIAHLLAKYGLFALFFGAGLEGELAVVAGGVLAERGMFPLAGAMIVATLGSFTADQTWYFLGRYARNSRFVTRMKKKSLFAKALDLLHRRPVPFILGFRFVYGMRTVSPVAIGVAGIPVRRFLPLNMIAAIIWAPLFTWLGYHLGKAAFPLVRRMGGDVLIALGGIIVVGIAVWLIVRWRRGPAVSEPQLPESDGSA
ncbi:DedA family protein [Sphingomonas antarctica]|uniref:DedA family protein n=1 Tax=Sphingomonas antarctica TaxID=2040274 RepID=UPI0039E8E075